MLEIHVMPRGGWPLLNPSPFCMKVAVYARLAQIPHRLTETLALGRAPKGKLPFIVHDGVRLGDSEHILAHLAARHPLLSVNPRPESAGHAIRRMLEESLYFSLVYLRWDSEEGWRRAEPLFFGHLSRPLRLIVPSLARRTVRKMLRAQGTGRHTPNEVLDKARADLDALGAYLAESPYAGGDSPSALDASAYAFVANVLDDPRGMPLSAHAAADPHLVAYAARMKEAVDQGSTWER